jgi:hypothetical protein
MSTPGDDFPQIQLKLLLDDFPTIVIISFYVFFILLITLLFYLYILIFDSILQLYKKRNYSLQNNDQIPLR